jgi:hypothetical protein
MTCTPRGDASRTGGHLIASKRRRATVSDSYACRAGPPCGPVGGVPRAGPEHRQAAGLEAMIASSSAGPVGAVEEPQHALRRVALEQAGEQLRAGGVPAVERPQQDGVQPPVPRRVRRRRQRLPAVAEARGDPGRPGAASPRACTRWTAAWRRPRCPAGTRGARRGGRTARRSSGSRRPPTASTATSGGREVPARAEVSRERRLVGRRTGAARGRTRCTRRARGGRRAAGSTANATPARRLRDREVHERGQRRGRAAGRAGGPSSRGSAAAATSARDGAVARAASRTPSARSRPGRRRGR